jgi:hypothetical protein
MGQFKIEIVAVGGHGCQRAIYDREKVDESCKWSNCPDCKAREFVKWLKARGINVEVALLKHWPGTEHQVIDDLSTLVRTGEFMPKPEFLKETSKGEGNQTLAENPEE